MKGNNTLLFLLLGVALVYIVMQQQPHAPAPLTQNPAGGTPPAGGSVEGAIAAGFGFFNNVFDALKSNAPAQVTPKTN